MWALILADESLRCMGGIFKNWTSGRFAAVVGVEEVVLTLVEALRDAAEDGPDAAGELLEAAGVARPLPLPLP